MSKKNELIGDIVEKIRALSENELKHLRGYFSDIPSTPSVKLKVREPISVRQAFGEFTSKPHVATASELLKKPTFHQRVYAFLMFVEEELRKILYANEKHTKVIELLAKVKGWREHVI